MGELQSTPPATPSLAHVATELRPHLLQQQRSQLHPQLHNLSCNQLHPHPPVARMVLCALKRCRVPSSMHMAITPRHVPLCGRESSH